MKKLVIGASLLAMCTVPLTAAAGTTLYGQMRYSFNLIDEDGAGAGIDGLRGQDNVSLLGVKGSYGDSLKAFYHLQTGAPSDANGGTALNQRFYFAGLKGGFGKVAYGRMTNAYKMPGFKLDPFYNLSHINAGGAYAGGGATYGLSGATNGFTDNALQYETPSMGGVKVTAGVFVDDSNEDDHGFLAGASWGMKGINVGGVFATNSDTATIPNIDADGDAYRIYGSYKMDAFKVGASFENVETGGTDINYLYLTGTVTAGKVDISASLGMVDDGAAEGEGLHLGAFYNITKNTKVFALLGYTTLESDNDPMVVSLGAIHKFSLGTK